jgi:hypothetical protein
MKENANKQYFFVFALILIFLKIETKAQGILVERKVNLAKIDTVFTKIDPARYHKIQIIDFKIGSTYSDDRAFQQLLKNKGFQPGTNNFYSIGINYSFLVKKVVFGLKGDFAVQTDPKVADLRHRDFQAGLGYAFKRKNNLIFTVNGNVGSQTSTIRFGSIPPDFLLKLDYDHSASKLFQKQFIIGPSINLNKIFNKKYDDGGFSLGLEFGVNFAPFNSKWQYGFTTDDGEFIGETIIDMPHAAKSTYFTSLKFGFWRAK